MNTKDSSIDAAEDTSGAEWLREKEEDLASWLDEIDLGLHEQMVCGTTQEDDRV